VTIITEGIFRVVNRKIVKGPLADAPLGPRHTFSARMPSCLCRVWRQKFLSHFFRPRLLCASVTAFLWPWPAQAPRCSSAVPLRARPSSRCIEKGGVPPISSCR
jgi:hypothetical protein